MPDSALPINLQGRKHEDWIWPFNKISRGLTAFKWNMPPRLLIGYNVKTWNTAEKGDESKLNYLYGDGWVSYRNMLSVQNYFKTYGPNAIQKLLGTWRFGFHISWPLGFHMVIKLWRYRDATKEEIEKGYDGIRMIYFRIGARWDSYDAYYQFPAFFIGLTYN